VRRDGPTMTTVVPRSGRAGDNAGVSTPHPVGVVSRALNYLFVQRRFSHVLPIPLVLYSLVRLPHYYWKIPGGLPVVFVAAAVLVAANVLLLVPPLRPGWPMAAELLAMCAASGLLIVAMPGAPVVIVPFLMSSIAARRCTMPGAVIVVVGALLALVVTQQVLDEASTVVIIELVSLSVFTSASFARRNRVDRLEEMELELAREQTFREEHARAAALAERARIAREVHDVLAHSLSALSLNLQGARLMLERDEAGDEVVDQVRRAQKLAAEGLAEARRAVAALRDDPVSASRAIADLVTATRLETGADARFAVEGTPRDLPGPVETTLYRTAQEALSNAGKHAPGAPVRVALRYSDGQVELSVADHPGQRPTEAAPGGYGLTGMRERAELIGGTLRTGPIEDGWRVDLVVPT
jgi:signal transduction histidine kinase